MKILFNFVARKGGSPVYAYSMAKALIEKGHEIYLVTSDKIENRELWDKLPLSDKVYLRSYTGKFSFFVKSIFFRAFGKNKVKRRFRNVYFDASYHPIETLWGGTIDKVIKAKKYIVTIHDPIEHETNSKYPKWLKNFLVIDDKKKMTDVVILSECFREVIHNRFDIDDNHIQDIKHANFDYYFEVCNVPDYKYNDSFDKHFVFFGRIDAYKGLEILAKAYDKLSNEENVDLTIIGSGDFSYYKEEYSKLKNCTVINRWIKDEEVASFFKDEKVIVVLPYISSTQSGVIPIAQSAERLLIVTKTGGMTEQLENNVDCLMAEPNDFESLYRVMKKSLSIKDCSEMIKKSKSKIQSLTWDKSAEKLIELISR